MMIINTNWLEANHVKRINGQRVYLKFIQVDQLEDSIKLNWPTQPLISKGTDTFWLTGLIDVG